MDYADSFKMYLTTKMPNPHYLPEVCIKVNIINFTVTMEGLEDQLLGQVNESMGFFSNEVMPTLRERRAGESARTNGR